MAESQTQRRSGNGNGNGDRRERREEGRDEYRGERQPTGEHPDTGRRMDVYTIIEREGREKNFWLKIGSAWVNKDGSINARLDALPANGTIHLRVPRDREPGQEG